MGLVGYFSYDYLGYSEPAVRYDVENSEGFKDVDLMLFDKVIAFDHLRQKIILIVNMPLDDVEVNYNKAVMELNRLVELLRHGAKKNEPSGKLLGQVTPLFNKEQFCGMVEKAQHYIREGDIFQIVLSNRLRPPLKAVSSTPTVCSAPSTPPRICSISQARMWKFQVLPPKHWLCGCHPQGTWLPHRV